MPLSENTYYLPFEMMIHSIIYLNSTKSLRFMLLQGLIQSVFELHDGSGVVVTIGKYVTPRHKDINGNGVEPDFRSIPGKLIFSPEWQNV